jgi:RNA polymerase sigma-70 factor, ECF subfamily
VGEDGQTALLLRVAGGDRAAFRDLYGQTAPKLAGVLTRMLRDQAEVEDALQDVYVRVWNRAAKFDPERGQALGWLIAVARNLALDRLRARPEARGFRRAEALPDGPDPVEALADTAPGAEALLVAAGEAGRVSDCFAELDPDRARMVQGAYLQGLSYQDLADRHAVPLNTVRTWLRRSLQRLRECLDR